MYQNVLILYRQHGFISTEYIIPYLSPAIYWLQFNIPKLYSLITLYILGIYIDSVSLIIYWQNIDCITRYLSLQFKSSNNVHPSLSENLNHYPRTHPIQLLCLKRFHHPQSNDGIRLLVFVYHHIPCMETHMPSLIKYRYHSRIWILLSYCLYTDYCYQFRKYVTVPWQL